MSGRYHSYDKGSSRSTRDDSRPPREKERHRDRSRSRSPAHRSRRSRERSERSSSSKDYDRRRDYDDKYDSKPRYEDPEEVPAPPPPPRITKISIGFNKPTGPPVKMSLGAPTKAPKPTIASVFNADDDDEPEEMPAEAKMRMRNIGRETPTSAGPNSFGKTKQGFCDAKKVFEKNLKSALDQAETNKPSLSKLPQTIYKIKGP